MKSISYLILSISIHILLVVSFVIFYVNTQKKLEANKTSKSNKKLICVNLSSYDQSPTQLPTINKLNMTNKEPKIKKKIKNLIKKEVKKKMKIKKKEKTKQKVKAKRQKQKHVLTKRTEKAVKNVKKKNKINNIYNEFKTKKILKAIINTNEKAQHTKKCIVTNTKQKQKNYTSTNKYRLHNVETIRKLIAENLYYPRKARKRHIEGIVNVRFRLTQSGKITDIQILSNSPKILSKAAITTLENIEELFPHPDEDMMITIPIVYKIVKEH